ncbi:TadE/TadG family type IV pilus assembly protein [Burkholderia guangdongensis]|uniref:TadE/TadG family type IV pilus assembly protein n=1 Tax=Burkholderia guangdongensis TaxID=1792500 RepID=UPI0015C8F031|nr:TadE/TadG family type IV pilus assembly protein [Burkholderia guangdongensis]
MNARRRFLLHHRAERGATAVEFAIVCAVFCTLLIGIIEFGRVMFYWNTASEAVRLAARTATVCDVNSSVVAKRVTTLLPILQTANVSVSYTPSGCTASTCSFVTVSVTNVTIPTFIPLLSVRAGGVPMLGSGRITVTMPPFTTTLPRESLTSSTGGTVCQ